MKFIPFVLLFLITGCYTIKQKTPQEMRNYQIARAELVDGKYFYKASFEQNSKLPRFQLIRLFKDEKYVYAGITWEGKRKIKYKYNEFRKFIKCPKEQVVFDLNFVKKIDLKKIQSESQRNNNTQPSINSHRILLDLFNSNNANSSNVHK